MTRLPDPFRYAIWTFVVVLGVGLPCLTTIGPLTAGQGTVALFQLFHGLVLSGILVVWMLALLYTCGDEEETAAGDEPIEHRDRPAQAA